MSENSFELKLCPECGSTEYMENYPSDGMSICEECGHEITTVILRVIQENLDSNNSSASTCPFCHEKEQQKPLLFKNYGRTGDITVFKCQNCRKLYGFRTLLFTGYLNEDINDGDFGGKAVTFAKDEGHFLYSSAAAEKVAKALKQKEKDPLDHYKKTFQSLVKEKSPKMLDMGIATLTIDIATWKVSNYLNRIGSITDKQIELLFSAAITLTQDELSSKEQLKGKRLTERQIAEIFNADRNTTRKWKALL